MCIPWTRVLYSVVITWQSNPPISQFNSQCNEFTCFWSMFIYNNIINMCSFYIRRMIFTVRNGAICLIQGLTQWRHTTVVNCYVFVNYHVSLTVDVILIFSSSNLATKSSIVTHILALVDESLHTDNSYNV